MAQLHFSGDQQADRLISNDPLALLIGMVLDQQISIEQAFRGPAALVERLGFTEPIDPHRIFAMDPETLVQAFSRKPSIHRYPASMATRVHELCGVLAREYEGDASRIWRTARDGEELRARVGALPGFGPRKARIFVALCGKQLGSCPPGWELASHPFGEPGSFLSVADVVDAASLAEVRRRKREAKSAAKAAGGSMAKAAGGSMAKAAGGSMAKAAGGSAAAPTPAGKGRSGTHADRTAQ